MKIDLLGWPDTTIHWFPSTSFSYLSGFKTPQGETEAYNKGEIIQSSRETNFIE